MLLYFVFAAFTYIACETFKPESWKNSIVCAFVWPVFWCVWVYLVIKELKDTYDKKKRDKRLEKYRKGKDD